MTHATSATPQGTQPRQVRSARAEDHAFPMLGQGKLEYPPEFRFMWAQR